MLSSADTAVLKDWADAARKAQTKAQELVDGRDQAIGEALRLGAGVAEVVRATGLTRARVYQIKESKP